MESSCTCWTVETEAGASVKAGWVALHSRVRLRSRDGVVVDGWTYGPAWWATEGGDSIAVIEVEPVEGPSTVVPLDQISTLSPLEGITAERDLLAAFARLISERSRLGTEEQNLSMLVDEHTTIEVAVRQEHHPCTPGVRPDRRQAGPFAIRQVRGDDRRDY